MRTMITQWLPQSWRQKGRMLAASIMMMACGAAVQAQAPANDECSGAIALTAPSATCTNTAGTTVGATLSMAATPCSGNPDDDVWYSFVPTTTDVKIDLSGITAVVGTSTDMYFQVLSGTCSSLTSLLCSDPNSGIVGGLTPGQTYYIRVYTYFESRTTFNICVTNVTAAPTACATLAGPANNSQTNILPTLSWNTATNATTYDVYLGTVNPPTTVHTTVTGTSYTFTTPLSPATDYYWYIVPKNSIGSFTNCSGNTRKFTTVAPPANDQCANAVVLTQGTTCVNTTGNTAGAMLSMAATPCLGNPDDDVWYSFVATATDAQIDLSGVSGSTNMYFQVLSGTCGSMTSLLCSDPDNGVVGGLTPGQTYYIRVYSYGVGTATFSICVTNLTAAPTACATLANPASNGQVGVLPTLSWNTTTNATAYDIYFDGNNPPTTLAATVTGNATTSYTFTTPQPLGDRYWYVVPKNSIGAATGCATNTRKLTIVASPANDNCAGATTLTVNPNFNCGITTAGTTVAATQSTETPPTVNAPGTNDDVWYKFTATSTFHRITLSNVTGVTTDLAMAIYSGACGALVHIQSSDPETMDVSGLTPGQTYTVRVYTYTAAVNSSASFNICVGSLPAPPPNDDCGGAITLTVNPDYNCAVTTTGTTTGATQSTETAPTVNAPGADDDVWYSFTATNSTHIITLSDVTGTTDMAMAIYSGACGSLAHIQSSDPETMGVTGLVPGQVYKIRVYTYTSTFSNWATSFKICVGAPPAAPANDNCSGAVALTVNPDYNCGITTNGTTLGATASTETAPGVAATGVNDDVWYSFTATNATHLITLSNITGPTTDMVIAVYSGACGALVHVQSSDPETMIVTGLTPGQSYRVRVFTYASAVTSWATSFNICVGTPPAAPPANDDCGGAVALTVNPDYNCGVTTTGSTFAATQSTETAPTVGATGVNDDVWYTFTATNAVHTISLSNVFGTVTDMAMAVYSGACGALVHIQSSDPNNMTVTGLTPGQTYRLRVYTYAATATSWATFTVCVGTPPAPPANNDCANAQLISQLPTCTTTAGTTAGATLSMAATPCFGNPDDDVWYSFIATGTDAQVSISGVTAVFGASTDMYFQVLSGACGATTSLLCSDPNVNSVTGLTPGQLYYIRVYTYGANIAAAFNICVTNISTPTLCLIPTGFTVPAASVTANAATLNWTAPALGIPTGYQWEVRTSGVPGSGPTGLAASGSTTTATTATTGPVLNGLTTYSAYVRTNCIAGNTSDWSAAVSFTTLCSNPPVIVSKKDSSRCGNGAVVLEATSIAGTEIRWYTASSGGSPISTGSPFITPAITGTTTYYASAAVTGTGNLCEGPRVAVNATIHTPPTATISPAGPIQICAGSSTTLTGGGGSAYQWRNAAGNIAGQTNASLITSTAGSYQVVAIDGITGCGDTSAVVIVNSAPAPVVNLGNDTAFCSGGTLTLNAGNPTATFLWDNGSTAQTRAITTTGTYYVKASIGNCEDSDTILVTVNPVPVVNLGNDTTICHNATLTLNAGNPGATYAWSNGTTAQTLAVSTAGNYSVVVTNANNCVGTDNITVSTTSPPEGNINAVYGSAATYTFNVLNPQNTVAYTWDFGDGSPKTAGNPVQHTYTHNGIYTVSLILKGDCSDSISRTRTVDVFDAGSTSIPSMINNNDLLLYPNPATDIVTLENRNNLKMKQITVYNVVGQVISSTKADSGDKHQLQTRSLAQGVYTLRIETDKGIVIRKFEIVR